jgi:hypothetical protein
VKMLKIMEGKVVHYILTDSDADAINSRHFAWFSEDKLMPGWVLINGSRSTYGGNEVKGGDHCPGMIVKVWPHEFGEGIHGVNVHILLDGNDSYWVQKVRFADGESNIQGTVHWIETVNSGKNYHYQP